MFAFSAPPETVRSLQEIDPDADLVHLEGDEWLLGVRRSNPAAQKRLQHQLARLDPNRTLNEDLGREFQLLQFFATAPFRPIQLYRVAPQKHQLAPYEFQNHTFGEVVRDFRERDFNWRNRREEAFDELKKAVSMDEANDRRTDVVRDFIDAEAPSLFRFVMQQARSFAQRVSIPTGGRDGE